VEAASAGCTRCKLSEKRSTIVFGAGSPEARLVIIGEGPGEEEDRQGKPFVGRAGQLLTKMLDAVGLTREEVYICNIVKCRPPGNRNPEPEEIAACAPFLAGQLAAIQPGVICTLGTFATQHILRTREPISRLRGQVHSLGAAVVIPVFHPAFLLRNPGPIYRRQAYDDLKLIRREYDRVRGQAPAGA
jgi:DNA polymerase